MTQRTVFLVQALAEQPRSEAFTGIEQVLTRNGIQLLPSLGQYTLPNEYQADVGGAWARGEIAEHAERYRPIIEAATALVVVNNLPEAIKDTDGKTLCEVPFAVGRLSLNFMRIATDVFGENSGQIFLSHNYPNISELSSVPQTPSVQKARVRLLSAYQFLPIALQGNYAKLATIGGAEAMK
ncbi:MAG TPA: hypothetical protein VFB59_05820 [Candidatus Saccharimonadales bacterium]|nr:hypothetical protein [Candidatus Saccharimonadales bacterium]